MTKPLYYIFTKSIGIYINLLSYVFPEKAILLAYSLFSSPREGKLVESKLPKTLLKAKRKTLKINEKEFETYSWEGNATVILVVHGWESNSSRWKKMLPFLQKTGSTIVAIDAPGHGLSSGTEFNIPTYASFINGAVNEFNPQYLIGHSIGGKTCLYYQSVYQNTNLKKIVILGSPSDFKIILNNYVNLLSLNTTILKGLEEQYLKVFKVNLDEFTGKHFATKIKTKGLIAHDSDDTVVKIEEAKKIATAWQDAIFIETEGLGHSMHDNVLYEKVTSFLFED